MATTRRQAGDKAEQVVLEAARSRGMACLARNYQTRHGELDLVLEHSGTTVVVEVRFRSREDFGSAAASVNRAKQQRIIAATRQFLSDHPRLAEQPLRFDVVGVDASAELDWIEQAFIAD